MSGEALPLDELPERQSYIRELTSDPEPRPPLSKLLWGIDWASELPLELSSDGRIVVEHSSFERALPFITEHYATIFEQQPDCPFQSGSMTGAKLQYFRDVADVFEVKSSGRTVGLLLGNPVDWSTYYLRSAATLLEHQGSRLWQRFFPKMFDLLRRAGVERVEAETSPSNMAVIHALTRSRFNFTGTVLSERWGALIRLTKFLNVESEDVFLRQFCAGVMYQRNERSGSGSCGETKGDVR